MKNPQEELFWKWAEENVKPWPTAQKLLNNYWIVWQAAWNHAKHIKEDDDDGRC